MPSIRSAAAAGAIVVLLLSAACSHRMGINRMASALAASSSVYESDDDPEFVRLAAPSTLKTVEMLLAQAPDHPQLLLTACSGFTEYAYAFLHVEGELKGAADPAGAAELRRRAAAMYRRGRSYCLRGLRERHAAFTEASVRQNAATIVKDTQVEDVPWLYWTGASWGSELLLSDDRLKRIGELAAVRVLMSRARDLDDRWQSGAIYEALMALDALPALVGGSPTALRADFDRAIALSNGHSVFAYLTLAQNVSDAAEKRRLLEQAVAIDVNQLPGRRMTNLIAQRYARALLGK